VPKAYPVSQNKRVERCGWATKDLDIAYHDNEWGVPSHDDRYLFEMLTLEGAQAGLSWSTILVRRETYRKAFDNFDAVKIASYGEAKAAELMLDPGIIRNRAKIASTIGNAKATLAVKAEHGSFDKFIWSFVNGKPIVNSWSELSQLPAESPESKAMSKELKRRGFTFVGPTICYAFMQAVGMVDDHMLSCFRRK
jgi:DNA-3-methyladenine glycosylase I